MNIIYKWLPYDIWEQAEYEAWLKEQASIGLRVQKVGSYWGKFEKGEAVQREYRIGFCFKELEVDAMTTYDWQRIEATPDFVLYESDRALPEDILYQEKNRLLEDLRRKKKSNLSQMIGSLVIASIALGVLLLPREQYVLRLITQRYNALGLLIFAQFIRVYEELKAYRGFSKLRKGVQENGVSETKRIKRIGHKWINIVFLVGLLIFFFVELGVATNSGIELPIKEIQLPIVQLSGLEENPTLKRNPDDIYSFYNTYKKHGTPLAYRMYESEEEAYVEQIEDGDKRPKIETEFYELTFKEMREPLVKDLIQRYQNKVHNPVKEIVKEDIEGLEDVYILDDNDTIAIIGVKGNRVMYINYKGNAKKEEVIQEMVRKIAF